MKSIQIRTRAVGTGAPCFLVAEIGVNHNGNVEQAKRMIDAAARVGADSVKFQSYRTEDFVSDRTLTLKYVWKGKNVEESHYDFFKRCELSRADLLELKKYCDDRGVIFHSTPTSEEGISDLIQMGVPVLKNGSDYLTNLPLIRAMGKTGLPTVLSTGMSVREEIAAAVQAFRETGNEQLVLLHCTSSYPTPPEEAHLRKIPALAEAYGCLVGFSDHTEGVEAAVGSVALGACWIEKHFTLDKNQRGPDHRCSSDPIEFETLVTAVRRMEQSLGDSRLGWTAAEEQNRRDCRLSCVAAHFLPAGHALTEGDLAFRRPGTGLPPAQASSLVGRRLKRDLKPGTVIQPGDLE